MHSIFIRKDGDNHVAHLLDASLGIGIAEQTVESESGGSPGEALGNLILKADQGKLGLKIQTD